MKKIGITGGIGCGKSYVSRLLAEQGIPVFDCDSQAKELTLHHPQIRKGLIELLGEEVYQGDALNKSLMISYLFASKANAARINAIVHPCVREAFREWTSRCQAQGHAWVAMESAILYESGFDDEVDFVVAVHAPLDVRCQRVVLRDGVSVDAVKKRISAQMSDDEKCQKADFVIENDGKLSLSDQLAKLFSLLKS